MALGTMSVCLTVLVLNLHHRDAERPVPRWARVLVLRHLARLLCVRARKPKTMAANLDNLDLALPDGEDGAAGGADIKDGLRNVSLAVCKVHCSILELMDRNIVPSLMWGGLMLEVSILDRKCQNLMQSEQYNNVAFNTLLILSATSVSRYSCFATAHGTVGWGVV